MSNIASNVNSENEKQTMMKNSFVTSDTLMLIINSKIKPKIEQKPEQHIAITTSEAILAINLAIDRLKKLYSCYSEIITVEILIDCEFMHHIPYNYRLNRCEELTITNIYAFAKEKFSSVDFFRL